MSVTLYRHAWGAVGQSEHFKWKSLLTFTRDAVAEGYTGVEFPMVYFDQQPEETAVIEAQFKEILADTGLTFMPLIATLPKPWGDFGGHLDAFKVQIERAKTWGVTAAAVHTGADSFDDETVIKYYRLTTQIARDAGIEPFYETHRARPMYNPWRTVKILEALPDIWLTADFAHWLPVVDRLPYDLEDLFKYCAERTGHLHARMGHEKGPQIPDPRDPIWEAHVAIHEQWWDWCIEAAQSREHAIAITPEFGPWPYLDHVPFTHQPVANVADVVEWVRDRLKRRYMN